MTFGAVVPFFHARHQHNNQSDLVASIEEIAGGAELAAARCARNLYSGGASIVTTTITTTASATMTIEPQPQRAEPAAEPRLVEIGLKGK
jgi:hypothetical protein